MPIAVRTYAVSSLAKANPSLNQHPGKLSACTGPFIPLPLSTESNSENRHGYRHHHCGAAPQVHVPKASSNFNNHSIGGAHTAIGIR